MTTELFPTAVRASVVGWSLAVGVLGAVVGLIVFGVVAAPVSRSRWPGCSPSCPSCPLVGLFWLLPETRGREPEDLWPDQ